MIRMSGFSPALHTTQSLSLSPRSNRLWPLLFRISTKLATESSICRCLDIYMTSVKTRFLFCKAVVHSLLEDGVYTFPYGGPVFIHWSSSHDLMIKYQFLGMQQRLRGDWLARYFLLQKPFILVSFLLELAQHC